MKSKFSIIFTIFIGIIIITMIFSSKTLYKKNDDNFKFEEAVVLDVYDEAIEKDNIIDDLNLGYQQIKIRVLTGKYSNEEYNIKNPLSRMYNVYTKVGDKIIVSMEEENERLCILQMS